jgi:Protein of unknown function (DUF664)
VAAANVKLFNIMVQIVGETDRHARHADILREQLDGRVGESEQGSAAFQEYDATTGRANTRRSNRPR